ncbi:MAG: translocation/assembly module TamB [Saprospiraceae bacterium]|nr:translocation/assembly module TamB [Saprospiraceae bacterium]
MQVGNLSLDAVSKSKGNYAANLVISGGAADLVLDGSYSVVGDKTSMNLDLDLKSVELALIENFTNKAISDAEGTISGKVKITGSPEKPIYDGSFQFRNATVTVTAVNERFTLADEQLSVRNQGLYFDRFTIRDSRGESSAITGRIDTEKSLTNPEFFLDIDAKDFRMLNSTRKDNDMYFGSLLADLDIAVRGNMEKPIVTGRVRLNRGSNVTFIIPETQVAAVDKEGVVVFVNMKDSTAQDSAVIDAFQTDMFGLQLSAVIEIDSSTIFTIVIDEQSGDNLLIRGEANLSVDMEANGRIGISGEYMILGGHYEMSLYEIVQRRFELTRGSRITWTGEPLRGALDLTALYRTKTSTVDLMGSQLAGADQATINRYRQDLPFEVLLKIKGTLLRPDISFGLDMPELQRNAIGGNVYNKIQQLNENESELNKQVFSLIVLNRFLPEDLSQASGGGGGANEMARSSVSKLLSSQLNSLSGKYIKGIDLDFNLDSYTDYQTGAAQNRTQLNVNLRKALLNDRLIVSVGSQLDLEGENPNDQPGAGDIIGDISLDYLLVPDGRYRLRGFRRNEFEGIIDGQIIVTGLSVAYNRDFDNIRELWKKPVVIKDSLPEVKEKKED